MRQIYTVEIESMDKPNICNFFLDDTIWLYMEQMISICPTYVIMLYKNIACFNLSSIKSSLNGVAIPNISNIKRGATPCPAPIMIEA